MKSDDASAYVFAHHMIWDVVYTQAGDARRRLFLRRALDVLEAAREPAAVLAYHALAAATEAAVHFEKARQLAQEGPLAGAAFESHPRDLYLQLGRAYELDGRPEQASAVYDQLSKLARRVAPFGQSSSAGRQNPSARLRPHTAAEIPGQANARTPWRASAKNSQRTEHAKDFGVFVIARRPSTKHTSRSTSQGDGTTHSPPLL